MERQPQHIEFLWRGDTVVFQILKCCSTSVRKTLMPLGFELKHGYEDLSGCRKVAIIRDPIDRFLSAFAMVFHLGGGNMKNLLGDFVMTIWHLSTHHQDPHFLPQCQFLKDEHGKPYGIDDYIMFSDLNTGWDRLGFGKLRVDNVGENAATVGQLSEYIGDNFKLLGALNNFYMEDIKMIGGINDNQE